MNLSVIIATYNHFKWLRLVLEGLRLQTTSGFEIVLADDGSSAETVAEIKSYIEDHPQMKIIHVWQEDAGWRKDICLNKAVEASSGEYLLFLDADCVPSPRWIEDHLRLRRPKTIIAGRRATFTPELSAEFEKQTVLEKGWFKRQKRLFLRNFFKFSSHDHPSRVFRLPILGCHGILERPTGNLLGCNFGIWRNELLELNGFDERYLDPGLGEDIDLAVRAVNNGCRILKVPHQALMIHRWHQTRIGQTNRSNNPSILNETKRLGLTSTPYGIKKQQ